ncbi:MAG: aminotransferase class V-fold PLP-dependent enzyme [Deltaproteobacteria bacterium]|nr:aminotransferase class V-fold PLP-dependent enzyme [Deltaproteobacteria bacterium]
MKQARIYLDNAATSFPKPQSVYARIDEILRVISGNPGRASHRMALEASRVIFRAREAAARLINAPDSARIAFTKNTTEAINIGLKGLLKPQDHIVTTSFEHNSVVKTLSHLETLGVTVTKVRPDAFGVINPAAVDKAVTAKTKAVCMTHASNVFGAIEPVAEVGAICRKRGVIFMVDGAQTLGALPVDVEAMHIDVLAAAGHKSLFGPQGTGFIYVRQGLELPPIIHGGTGEIDTVLEMPERLECGTMNTPGVGGLGAGIEFILNQGVKEIRRHEESIIRQLLEGLAPVKGVNILGPATAGERVSLVSFNINGIAPAEVGRRLDEDYGVMVRTGAHCAPEAHREALTYPDGAVRVSPGYFSTPAEIDEFLRAIRETAKG